MSKNSDSVVWFDLDDTLWDFTANSHDALEEVYHHFNLERFWADVDAWRESYHKVNDRLWKEFAEGIVNMNRLRWDRFYIPLKEAGASDLQAEEITSEADGYYLNRLGIRGKLVEGARELLAEIKSRGFRIGIISNGFTDVQYNKIRAANIESYIDYVVLSEDVGVSKPNTAIFRYAQKVAEVKACNCIMIGDNESTDIAGAVKALWPRVIWYNPAHHKPQHNLVLNPGKFTTIEIVDKLSDIHI